MRSPTLQYVITIAELTTRATCARDDSISERMSPSSPGSMDNDWLAGGLALLTGAFLRPMIRPLRWSEARMHKGSKGVQSERGWQGVVCSTEKQGVPRRDTLFYMHLKI